MKRLSGLLAGLALLTSGVGCCCHHLCGQPCAPACPPAYPACPTCPTCPSGGCPPAGVTPGVDPFGPPMTQPTGYYGAMNAAPIASPVVYGPMPQTTAYGPVFPQTSYIEPLPTY